MKKYTEAIEEYTVALSTNIKSCPFVAICFCNRAAAHQALGQITDAISDCSMAMALDGNYAKVCFSESLKEIIMHPKISPIYRILEASLTSMVNKNACQGVFCAIVFLS